MPDDTPSFERCSHCGKRFESDVSYPVEQTRDEDGNLQFHSFCSEECREAWAADG